MRARAGGPRPFPRPALFFAPDSCLGPAVSSDASAPLRTRCQNCDAELKGPYCAACGQKDFDFHQSFGHVVHEALETWFHVDGKFFRGFYDLLFRPGAMTREFNEGQRARHVPPLRFYLVISVVFFLVIPPHDIEREGLIVQDDPAEAGSPQVVTGGDGRARFRVEQPNVRLPFVSEDTEQALGNEIRQKFEQPELMLLAFLKALPKTLLVCLPLFALFTRAMYWRSGWVYLQHLVLSVHLHTFVFLWWMVAYGWVKLVGLLSESLAGWLTFGSVAYLFYAFYTALRRAFGGSRKRAFVKGTLVGAAYVLALALAMGATFVVTLLV